MMDGRNRLQPYIRTSAWYFSTASDGICWPAPVVHEASHRRSLGQILPPVLGIDEHFFTRKRGYAITLVDLKDHKMFDVVLRRPETSLRATSSVCPGASGCVSSSWICPRPTAPSRASPNAPIVADRFHAIRLFNQHF
jgi:hypothetical protein